MRSSVFTLCQLYWDEINQFEMVGTCSTHERDEKSARFYSKILKGTDHFETLRTEGRIILKQLLKKQCGPGWGSVAGCSGRGLKSVVPLEVWQVLAEFGEYQVFQKNLVPSVEFVFFQQSTEGIKVLVSHPSTKHHSVHPVKQQPIHFASVDDNWELRESADYLQRCHRIRPSCRETTGVVCGSRIRSTTS